MESLPALLQALRQDAAAAPEDVVLRAQTALEELLTNSVTHGHASAQTGSQVGLSVRCQGGAVYLRYEDDLAAFDPADKLREALQRTENPLDQRHAGGPHPAAPRGRQRTAERGLGLAPVAGAGGGRGQWPGDRARLRPCLPRRYSACFQHCCVRGYVP